MKTIIKSILIIALCAFVFTDCAKYEDGPKFSFRSRKGRLEGDWKITKFSVNGVDQPYNSDYIIHIKKGGSYTAATSSATDEGKWEIGEDGDDVIFTSNDPNVLRQSYRILKLKDKEMWWREVLSNGIMSETRLAQ